MYIHEVDTQHTEHSLRVIFTNYLSHCMWYRKQSARLAQIIFNALTYGRILDRLNADL